MKISLIFKFILCGKVHILHLYPCLKTVMDILPYLYPYWYIILPIPLSVYYSIHTLLDISLQTSENNVNDVRTYWNPNSNLTKSKGASMIAYVLQEMLEQLSKLVAWLSNSNPNFSSDSLHGYWLVLA
jgi:hypothetical protein